jgi:hypothetical protein
VGFFHIVFHRIVENRERILETKMHMPAGDEIGGGGFQRAVFAVNMKAIKHP